MREIALFVEDHSHQQIIGALLERLARDSGVEVQLNWRSARRGHGRVVQEFKEFLRDLGAQTGRLPDMVIVASDANCKGLNERARELQFPDAPAPIVLAIPDPHVERWLLLDGAAFKAVFGRGCNAPDLKCSRDRYKQLLIDEIREAGVIPSLGGIEFAEDIVRKLDIARAGRADPSFKRFVDELSRAFQGWKASSGNA
jgi:Domain of unknown function (DUF4276)